MDTYMLNITELNAPFLDKESLSNPTKMNVLLDDLKAYDSAAKAWQLAYSFRNFYGMPHLSPTSFADLIDRLHHDDDLLSRYYR